MCGMYHFSQSLQPPGKKVFLVPHYRWGNRLHYYSWGHGAAKNPSCHLNTALSDLKTQVMATVLQREAQKAPGNDMFSSPSPSQPLGSSRGPFQATGASSCWLWPRAASPPQGSDSNTLRQRTKAALLAPSLETSTLRCISSPSDWLLPWQLATHLCLLCQQPRPECLPVHFLPKHPSLPAAPLTSRQL